MKIAYHSPLPPESSGIADYSALLLPALERRVDVEVVRRGRASRGADVALYHVGNSPESHAWIVEELRRRPGVVVLHDFVLHHLVAGMTLGRGDAAGYVAAMEREQGLIGRLLAQALLDGRLPPIWETRPEAFPLAAEVLELATGLVVHSRYVEELAREAGYAGPLWRIPHPAWRPPPVTPERVEGAPVIGSFGNLNPSKRVPSLLTAFSLLRRHRPDARLLLVGAVSGRYQLPRLPPGAAHVPYVDEERLWRLMAACDVHVSLRFPTMGETSGSAIRSLSLGKPLVVSGVGWFSELPDELALKVPVDETEVETLAAALELAAEHAPALGAAAAAYAGRELDLDRVADAYVAALEEAAGGETVTDAVLWEIAEAAAAVGIAPDDPTAAEIGRRLAEAGIAT